MLTLNGMWVRYLTSAAQAVSFGLLFLTCRHVLLSKRTANRELWLLAAGLCFFRTISSIFVARDYYYHGVSTETWMFVVNAAWSLPFGLRVFYKRYSIRRTAEVKETCNIIEMERILDEDTEFLGKKYQMEQLAIEMNALRKKRDTETMAIPTRAI